jgi:hypothetical protein
MSIITNQPALVLNRYPEEADAQTLRVGVLLDELDFPGAGVPDPRTGNIVVELKTANAMPLLRYSCSSRIISLPTAQLNARRCVIFSAWRRVLPVCPQQGRRLVGDCSAMCMAVRWTQGVVLQCAG